MEARELRIGNLMELPNGEISKVTGFTENGKVWFVREPKHEECALKINQVKPIPLTEEWLLKFGFGEMGLSLGYFYKPICGNFSICSEDFIFNINYKRYAVSNVISVDLHGFEIKYVHQLQNLYFALTGEELTIKK